MNIERIIDMHVHTDNSPDGVHSPMFICEQAVEKNLRAIAFCDHCEVDQFFQQKYNNVVFHSFFECTKSRFAFEGQLLVLLGIEIAQPFHDINLANSIIKKHNYDVVLGSIHHPKGFDTDVKNIPYDKIDVYKFMKDYFGELCQLAQWKECDIMAHITCPMRRIQGRYNIDFDYSKIQDEVDTLLEIMIKNDKVLEINTSGLRQQIGRTMPDVNILKRYKQLGGKYVSIGSDAHSAYDVGAGVREGMLLAKECGFDTLSFFVERQMLEIKNNI